MKEASPAGGPARKAGRPAGAPRVAALALSALGVVFGDIGTSPLYALRECFHGEHGVPVAPASVLGVLSLVFWALVVVVSVKYLGVVLRADNEGEGGVLALTALVTPRPKKPGAPRHLVVVLGLFGASLLYGDGMITPAISVLSAVEGLHVATPVFAPYVVPATVAVLSLLFLVQRHGTGRVGAVFGPVMALWFLAIGALGAAELLRRPDVLWALSPLQAAAFVRDHGPRSVLVLGAVFLVVTGAEALYADLGHFGRRPIRLGWFLVAFPCLLLNYLGQGALLLSDPAAVENPFFHLVPRWGLYPMVGLATAATVIASQAVISGAFSLTRQAVQLGYLPRVDVRHTSEEEAGQIYVPLVNAALFVACVALVVGFRSPSALAAAYGLAVTSTMVITTLLFWLVTRRLWGWGTLPALGLSALFLAADLAFLAGNAAKFLDGGWFPMAAGAAGYAVMSTWRGGREILAARLAGDTLPFDEFVKLMEEIPHSRAAGVAVYLTADPTRVPHAVLDNLRRNRVVHEQAILLSIVTAEVPRVREAEGVEVERLEKGIVRVVARHGFMQTPNVPAILRVCGSKGLPVDPASAIYFLARENLIPAPRRGMAMWREKLFAFLSRNAFGATRAFRIPPRQVVEIGIQVEL